jgi:hypothetical protein
MQLHPISRHGGVLRVVRVIHERWDEAERGVELHGCSDIVRHENRVDGLQMGCHRDLRYGCVD